MHSLLSSGILFFGVYRCLHWYSKQCHQSCPFVQQQLLQVCALSSNLIGWPGSLPGDGEKIWHSRQKKKISLFCNAIVRTQCEYLHRDLLIQECHRAEHSHRIIVFTVKGPLCDAHTKNSNVVYSAAHNRQGKAPCTFMMMNANWIQGSIESSWVLNQTPGLITLGLGPQ